MFEQHVEPIRPDEAARLEKFNKRGLLANVLRSRNEGASRDDDQKLVAVYSVSVEKCYIPVDFNEELPLYFLDLGGTILILFGQWLFDPHTANVPDSVFENWRCEQSFFLSFSLRGSPERGTVFKLAVSGISFVEAQKLESRLKFKRLREYEFIAGHGETLTQDLEKAGIIDSGSR